MKFIIAGGRDYTPTQVETTRVMSILAASGATEVVSGGAKGVDTWGEKLAQYMGIPVKRFPADWDKHGRSAGPIRNREMAVYADALVALKGGRGTANMVDTATKMKLEVYHVA